MQSKAHSGLPREEQTDTAEAPLRHQAVAAQPPPEGGCAPS
jgi:hypothetical protein